MKKVEKENLNIQCDFSSVHDQAISAILGRWIESSRTSTKNFPPTTSPTYLYHSARKHVPKLLPPPARWHPMGASSSRLTDDHDRVKLYFQNEMIVESSHELYRLVGAYVWGVLFCLFNLIREWIFAVVTTIERETGEKKGTIECNKRNRKKRRSKKSFH